MKADRTQETDLDFGFLPRFVLGHWRGLGAGGLCGLVLGVLGAVLLQPTYRAAVLVAPVTDSDLGAGLGSAAGQLGGLAALAGVNVGSDQMVNEHIAILRSREFGIEFILANDLAKSLFSEDWDAGAGVWRDSEAPTAWETWEKFDEDVRRVEVDRSTGLVQVVIEWEDPVVAAGWANDIVSMANERIRIGAVDEAQRSLQYLNEELAKAGVVEVRDAIYRLVETQVNRIMLANVRREFAFRVLDPAVPPDPDDFYSPNRPVLVVGGFILGLALAFVLIALAAFVRAVKDGDGQRARRA